MDKSGGNKKHHLFVSDSKREKLKRLSFVAEMGSDDVHTTPRKFKFPRKIFGDSNPASVPRKLRSAIKKRKSEPSSVPLLFSKRRLNGLVNGVEPLGNSCWKKSLLSMKNSCSDRLAKGATLLPMSKDEEEVAQTLSALAGMIPVNRNLETKTSDSEKTHKDPLLALKDSVNPKEELNGNCHRTSFEDTSASPMLDGSQKEPVQENFPIDLANLSWSNLSEKRQLNLNLQVSVASVHMPVPCLLRTCETKQEKPLLSSSESHAVDIVMSLERQHDNPIAKNDHDLTLKDLHGSGVGLSLQPSAVMFPSWLSTAISQPGLGAHEDVVSTEKISCSINSIGGKSWKKCAAHVYISRLIQVCQISEGKDVGPSNANYLRPSQCAVTGALDPPQHVNAARIEKIYSSPASCRNADEGAHCIPVNHRFQPETECPSISGCCGSKKQNFDFLTLSSGSTVVAADNHNTTEKSLDQGAKHHLDFLHSVTHNGTLLSFSLQQNRLPSNSYQDQVATISGSQVHLQMPPYYGNTFGPSHMGSTAKTALQPPPKQQQHQQQKIWTAPLAAQLRPGPLLSSHIANWPNRRQNLHSSTHHMPSLLPSYHPSLEGLGPKYLHITQQPMPLLGLGLGPSQPPLRAKPQHNQFPSICDDKGVRLCADGNLPLQLMCNERL